MKKCVGIGCFITLILCVICCSIFVYSIGRLFISPTPGSEEVAIESKYIEGVNFDEIYRAYKENELKADDTYKNNRYRITAKINGMSTSGLFNLTGGATLTMESKVGKTTVFFYAEFEKDQEDNLKQIKVGDTITFEGKCLSAGSWTDCEIITE